MNILLFTVLIFHTSCYTQYFQTHFKARKADPISQLQEKYDVSLDSTWTTKHAEKLLKILSSILQSQKLNIDTSIWHLSHEDLQNDLEIKFQNGLKFVTMRVDVFPIEGAQTVSGPDKRLYYAVVQFLTENGTNRDALKLILQERYGIHIDIPAHAIKETAENFSEFENEDLVTLISILEEFPQALHKIPQLKYIARKSANIIAPGVAWTSEGYITLAESIFGNHNLNDTRRLIAHEKAHFLWAYLFPEQLKQDWIQLGGWYKTPDSDSGWSTTKPRKEFVTDYAHDKNPNEDMAESLGYYLVYPDKLRACSPAKYEFIQNRIMLTYGERYMAP